MKLAFCVFKYSLIDGLYEEFLDRIKECLQQGHKVDVYTTGQVPVPAGVNTITLTVQGLWERRRYRSFIKQLKCHLKRTSYDLVVGLKRMPGLSSYHATPTNCLQALAKVDAANSLSCAGTEFPIRCKEPLPASFDQNCLVRAEWQGRPVLAKIIKKKCQAKYELCNYQTLKTIGVEVPTLLFNGWLNTQKKYVFLYEDMQFAQNLAKLLPKLDKISRNKLLTSLVTTIAKLHQAGLRQKNLQLKDFLAGEEKLYFHKLQKIVVPSGKRAIIRRKRMQELAAILAQLPIYEDDFYQEVYISYLRAYDDVFTLANFSVLKEFIIQARKQYLFASIPKIIADSDTVLRRRSWRSLLICDRDYDNKSMQIFLTDPEAVLQGPAVKLLKADNGCKVTLLEIGGHKLVVKRYNPKGIWRKIKCLLQPSQATASWYNAQRLLALEIATTKPIAILETRFGPLRGWVSYLISEYVPGKTLQDYFKEPVSLEEQLYLGEKITQLLAKLASIQISHGNLEASNILVAKAQPMLLDLDTMRLHRATWRWRLARRRDWHCFMRNWYEQPEIAKLFS